MKKAILLIVIIFSSSEILAADDKGDFILGVYRTIQAVCVSVGVLPGMVTGGLLPIKNIPLARVGIGVSPILLLASWQMFYKDIEDTSAATGGLLLSNMGSYSAVGGLTRLLKKDVTEEGCQNRPSVKKLSPSELKRLARGFKPRFPRR